MRVYVAGPYSKGDVVLNVRNAVAAADSLLAAGHTPFIPHLTHFWHLVSPKSYEEWLHYDFKWVECCDALVRLPGDSPGADREVAYSKSLGIPVYLGLDTFLAHQASLYLPPYSPLP